MSEKTYIEKLTELSEELCPSPSVPHLTGVGAADVLLLRGTCKRWGCPVCGARNGSRWLARIIHHMNLPENRRYNWYFLTITAHERWRGAERSLKNIRTNWRKLYMRMYRRYNDMMYVKVFEFHQDGSFHLHLIVNHKFGRRWLKDNARQCGLGYQAHSVRSKNTGQVAGYCAKYLIKSFEHAEKYPKNIRRIAVSQNWTPLPELSDNDREWKIHHTRQEQDQYVRSDLSWRKRLVDLRPVT